MLWTHFLTVQISIEVLLHNPVFVLWPLTLWISFLIIFSFYLGPETEVRGNSRWSWTQEKAQVVKLFTTSIYCVQRQNSRAAASSGIVSPSVCVCFAGCDNVLCKTLWWTDLVVLGFRKCSFTSLPCCHLPKRCSCAGLVFRLLVLFLLVLNLK